MKYSFSGEVIEWRGPAPFYFIALPKQIAEKVKLDQALLSYGWGVIPVQGKIGNTTFTTSLIPREGTFFLPIKNAVRIPEKLSLGDDILAAIELGL